jgi:hypothetical protein
VLRAPHWVMQKSDDLLHGGIFILRWRKAILALGH